MKLWIWETIHQMGLWLSAASPFQAGFGVSSWELNALFATASVFISLISLPAIEGPIPVAAE